MKPYYSQSGITIYHGDAEEVVAEIGRPELIITDPPYGMDYQSARRTEWQRKEKIQGDEFYPKWLFRNFPTNALFCCCRWDNLYDLPRPKSFIVWDKMRHGMGDLRHEFGRQWEAIAFYPGPLHKFTGRPIDVIRVACVPACDLAHPNEKPYEMFTPLLLSHAGRVVDPYCGSGSVLRACKELQRPAIGIEVDEQYCELAANRLSQEVFALT